MAFSILTDYPWYFILFCLLFGAGVSWLSYRRNSIATGAKWYSWPVWLLALLRFLSVSIIAFLLLSPVIKSLLKKVEKPVIIVAADNSQSILLNKDSAYYRKQYAAAVDKLVNSLGDKYDVRAMTFSGKIDDRLKINFKGKQTDISGLYDKLYNAYYNQNIGAVVTFSDGIYNQGQNPLYSAQKFNAPFYTVALGDTQPQKDLLIKNVQYNQIVYSGNFFPLQVDVRAKGYAGHQATLSISNKGKVIYSEPVRISSSAYYQEIPVKIEATGTGMQHYHLELSHQEGEISYVNNSYDVFIDILESKKKILLVGSSPHPDLSAMKSSIERNAFYEVNTYVYDDFEKEVGTSVNRLKNYQLAILHQLPGGGETAAALINALHEAQVPILYVLGNESALGVFNNLDAGLQIQSAQSRTNEVQGAVNPQFSLFTVSDDVIKNMPQWPPLLCPFGEYRLSDRQNIAVFQQVGKVRSDMPLLMFSSWQKQKTGIITGEGIWKWFMFDYANNHNQKASDEIFNKAIQYLSTKTDNRLFRVHPAKNLFYEDERIGFDAEVYNQSYEPVKDAVIRMNIRNEQGKQFTFNFQPKGSGYTLDAGYLPAGTYSYLAETKIGEKPYTLTGEFIVKKVELEFLETVANHQLLNAIAAQQGGKMVHLKDMDMLADLIRKRDDIKPVAYMQTDFKDLVNFKWLFFGLLALLTAEWFMRKYFGNY